MRIVSWNLGYAFSFRRRHDQAWHYLAALDPDIALLQEVLLPAWARERWEIEFRPIREWVRPSWRSPWLKLRSDPEPVAYSATGTVTLLDGLDLLIASVHTQVGVPSPEDYAGLDREAIRRPRRASLSHADVAYAIQRARVEGGRFLVGGDWNTARLWDRTHPGAYEVDFFARAETDGWVDCYRRFHPEGEGRTWFRGSDAPYQLDHVFCDPTTAAQLTACVIHAHPAETLGLSDHAPLVVELRERSTA